MTAFRRAFILRDTNDGRAVVGVEVMAGCFVLPNTAGYDADDMLRRVVARGDVDLSWWVESDTP